MAEYIEREAAIKAVSENDCEGYATWAVKAIPAADVRPVVKGKWENNHCSVCGMMPMGEEIWECCDFAPPKFEWFMNFCPNCGASMSDREEHDD